MDAAATGGGQGGGREATCAGGGGGPSDAGGAGINSCEESLSEGEVEGRGDAEKAPTDTDASQPQGLLAALPPLLHLSSERPRLRAQVAPAALRHHAAAPQAAAASARVLAQKLLIELLQTDWTSKCGKSCLSTIKVRFWHTF